MAHLGQGNQAWGGRADILVCQTGRNACPTREYTRQKAIGNRIPLLPTAYCLIPNPYCLLPILSDTDKNAPTPIGG